MTTIAITPKQTGGVEHRDASLFVGSKLNVFGNLPFDLTTYYGGKASIACVDLTRDEAEAIVAAIQHAFPEQADLSLPDLYDDGKGGFKTPVPTAQLLTVDGKEVVCVNWLDFKGWEVRRKANREGEAGLLLGWVRGSGRLWTVTATRPVPAQVSSYDRLDKALRALLKAANQ